MKANPTTPLAKDSTVPKQGAIRGRLPRLVRQIRKALKATKRLAFWDIEVDEDDIRQRLETCFESGYNEREAMESAIEGLFMTHEQTLKDAVMDQCRCATRKALSCLPNR